MLCDSSFLAADENDDLYFQQSHISRETIALFLLKKQAARGKIFLQKMIFLRDNQEQTARSCDLTTFECTCGDL